MDAPSSNNSGKGLLTSKSIIAVGMIILAVSLNFIKEVKWPLYLSYFIFVAGFLGSAYHDWKQGEKAEARSKVLSTMFVLAVLLIASLILRS